MSSGGGGGVNISMPTYEGSLEDALRAQVNILSGEGRFADIGSLQNVVEQYERPLRMSQAQIGTDVLRQTLLGEEFPATGFKSISPNETAPVVSKSGTGTLIDYTGGQHPNSTIETSTGKVVIGDGEQTPENQKVLDAFYYFADNPNSAAKTSSHFRNKFADDDSQYGYVVNHYEVITDYFKENADDPSVQKYKNAFSSNDGQGMANALDGLEDGLRPEKRYFKNEDGTDFVVPKDDQGDFKLYADTPEEAASSGGQLYDTSTIQTTRGGTGMLDLLGDNRNVQGTRDMTREERLTAIVDRNPAFADQYMLSTQDPNSPFYGDSKAEFMAKRIFAEGGEENLARGLEMNNQDASNLDLVQDEQVFGSLGRQAGFDDQGNFLGLSALAEDIQAGNLSRQRERDLSDVERLSGRFQDVMEDYAPGTASGLEGARELLEEQKEAMTTGGGTIDVPTESTFGGRVSGLNALETTVADPLQLQANTQLDQEVGRGQDSLRSALLGDAKQALGQGLTEREQAQIANAARARQTLMGRTFDQSGAIAEAEARVAEDNDRRMQNRSFAQSVIGQEAGLQQGDITRGMAQESEQAGLQQRADLAQAQLTQQQRLTELDSAQRAQLANQAQQQQANQFGVGATMDAQRLNEQLRQQGLGNYISAVGNLAQIEDQYTYDPFQAILGRTGGGSLQAGQGVLGQASYGMNQQPQYLNPESGLGFISQMAANQSNLQAANMAADASRSSGIFQGVGNIFGGISGGLLS
jgi:hypothetical protein